MAQQRADYPLDYSKGPEPADKNRVNELADSATDQLRNVAENAQEIAGKVAEQAREYGDKAQEVAKNFKPFVEKSLKEQPMSTLAAAAAVGFALGALWKK
jgi:ElaB/YqjD/DUF883 family membrane-anchored ribosome-binding protein